MIRAALRSSMSRISIRSTPMSLAVFTTDRKHRTSPRMSFNKPSQTLASSNGVALPSSPGSTALPQTQLPTRPERSHAKWQKQKVRRILSVDSDLEQVERRARLFRAVEALPEDQRKVILLRFGEEKSIREIASDLNRSEGAVKQLQFRGLENLRARLREEAEFK